jgi:hypothetical protein
MRLKKCYLFLFLCFIIACSSAQRNPAPKVANNTNQKINGISLVASPRPVNDSVLEPIKKIHANYVCLMPFAFMRSIDSPKISFNSQRQWKGETSEGVVIDYTACKKNNLPVMIKPQIWIGRGAFTGHIKMNTETDWKILENEYENFILPFAKLADSLQAAIFCIGTELYEFTNARPEFWKNLISKIRTLYKGKLTYAENWDSYKKFKHWQALDFIGVDAYFPLQQSNQISIDSLTNFWQPIKKELQNLHQQYNKPILFTEYGYKSVENNTATPWNPTSKIANSNNQAIALEALYLSVWQEPWFAGGFLWKWYPKVNASRNSTDYSPQGKLAEAIISKYYKSN